MTIMKHKPNVTILNTEMTKPEEILTQKPQAGLMAKVIALQNHIIDLRRSGKIITQQQSQLRDSLK